MTSEPMHPESEIQELLDGRLSPERRAEVEGHLSGCAECRRLRDALALVKVTVRAGVPLPRVPGEVVGTVAAAIGRELRRTTSTRPVGPAAAPRRGRRIALVAGLAAALLLAVIWLRPRPDSLPAAAAQDFARVRTGAIALALRTESPGVMEAFFIREGLPFRTRVFDFGMMGYRLVGGSVHALAGRLSALFVYRDQRGRLLVCEMYEGTMRDLPRAADVRTHGGFEFHVYRRGDRTVVFWQEGAVSCVLVGDGSSEDLIQLAFAKAMRAS
jgi:anti-sigma factor RsiW